MSVSTNDPRNDYTAGVGQTVFAYTFKIFANSDLEVYVDGVKKTLTTDYTVSGAGSPSGGNVTFVTAPGSDKKIAIVRAVPYDQQTTFVDNDKFPANTVNDSLDKGVMQAQQLLEKLARAIKFATSSTFKNVDLPDLSPSKYLRCNAAGTGLEWVTLLTTGTYADPVTTRGDMIRGSAAGTQERLPLDPAKKMLGNDGTDVLWRTAAEARTDLDVPQTSATILKSLVDAKGDLIVATAADTVARKAVGPDGKYLKANSAQADGLEWADISVAPSFLLLPTAAIFPSSNFPALTKNAGTNWVDFTLDYDQTTAESAYWHVAIPDGVTFSGATLDIYFRQAAATSNAVVWECRTLTRAEGEAWDTAGNTDTFTAETVPGTAGQVAKVSKALTVTGWAAGEMLAIRIDRKAGDAGDTVTEDSKFMFAVLRLTP